MKDQLPDPEKITCHQLWCDLGVHELRHTLGHKLQGKASRQVLTSPAAVMARANAAIQKFIDFENFRLQVHADALAMLHIKATQNTAGLTMERNGVKWYRPGKRSRLARAIVDSQLQEACYKAAFLVLVNTPIPEPKAEPVAPPLQKLADEAGKELVTKEQGKVTSVHITGDADGIIERTETREVIKSIKAPGGSAEGNQEVERFFDENGKRLPQPCDQCGGTGYAGPNPDESKLCTHCKGSGQEPAMVLEKGGAKA